MLRTRAPRRSQPTLCCSHGKGPGWATPALRGKGTSVHPSPQPSCQQVPEELQHPPSGRERLPLPQGWQKAARACTVAPAHRVPLQLSHGNTSLCPALLHNCWHSFTSGSGEESASACCIPSLPGTRAQQSCFRPTLTLGSPFCASPRVNPHSIHAK